MRKLPLEVLPAASLAVHVTRVIPTENRLPERGEHVTTGEGSTLSVALTPNVTTPPSRLVAVATILPGSDNTGAVTSSKRAVTVVLAVSVTLQVPVPKQPPPLQPVKIEPLAGVAVSVTKVPLSTEAVQAAPQLIPAGCEVAAPGPMPVLGTARVTLSRVKVAVTVVAAFKVTEQVPVPKQPPPLQPVKVEPVAGVAVSVTKVPLSNEAEQVAPQSIPGGSEVTVPLPVPALLTARVTLCGVKVAVTVVAAFRVTEQVPVPEQPPPLQPAKVEPLADVAVSVTKVPLSNVAEQVAPQLIPAGFEVTAPLPVPALLTARVTLCSVKVAVTVVAAFKVTEQLPVPVQPPPFQPAKVEPLAGVAVSVTKVPLSNEAEQAAPQSIPGGLEVTVSLPVPPRITERVGRGAPKRANTVVLAVRVTVQVLVPEHPPPLQPSKVEPVAGVAVRVTGVPLSKDAEQVAPQLIPAGFEVTVPLPAPSRTSASVGRFPPGPLTTVSVVLPLRAPEVAVIVVVPAARPAARPLASIVATVGSLLVHVTPPPIPLTVTGVNAQEGLCVQGRVPLALVATPSRPSSFRPQQRTVPSCRRAHVCSAPDDAAMALVIPVTGPDGVADMEPSGDPLPSWPQVLSPQQRTVPSWSTTQLCSAPGARARAAMPGTVVGVDEFAVLALPSRPFSPRPQHRSVPSWRVAHVWKTPASMATA